MPTTNREGTRWAVGVAGLVAVLAVAGCGREERLYDVSGTVTFGGKPVPKGQVFFDPDPTKGTTGGQGFATIQDGKYTTAQNGRGIRGGAYAIRVLGYDGKEANEAPFGQPLFPEYELKKDLPASDSELPLDIPVQRQR
jgi:hypothetical protein